MGSKSSKCTGPCGCTSLEDRAAWFTGRISDARRCQVALGFLPLTLGGMVSQKYLVRCSTCMQNMGMSALPCCRCHRSRAGRTHGMNDRVQALRPTSAVALASTDLSSSRCTVNCSRESSSSGYGMMPSLINPSSRGARRYQLPLLRMTMSGTMPSCHLQSRCRLAPDSVCHAPMRAFYEPAPAGTPPHGSDPWCPMSNWVASGRGNQASASAPILTCATHMCCRALTMLSTLSAQ